MSEHRRKKWERRRAELHRLRTERQRGDPSPEEYIARFKKKAKLLGQ